MAASKSAMSRALRLQSVLRPPRVSSLSRRPFNRQFHASRRLDVVKPFLLADIGEGITECQVIQWFVQAGARVEQFDKICEVQSDKASVEITSPFDGVIKKLYYEADDMAITGKPLVDIDIQSEISEADAQQLGSEGKEASESSAKESSDEAYKEAEIGQPEVNQDTVVEDPAKVPGPSSSQSPKSQPEQSAPPPKNHKGALAAPAVRRLTKENNINITDIKGTGKDGRVLKEDVERHVSGKSQPPAQEQQQQQPMSSPKSTPTTSTEDKKVPLTHVQTQMFKTMTKALNIPHFLYTTSADMGSVTAMRQKINARSTNAESKVTHLPFILKALSLALQQHPLLNSSLDTKDEKKPELTYRGAHHFGVAIDAPSGLLVPVVKNVQDLSITEIALALRQLSQKAKDGKLAPGDFSGTTFTVSNIGSVGGGVVAPVITAPQVAILGIGRSKIVPAFNADDELVKKEELILSWSADHRVVDGAECARCAEKVKNYLEDPGTMIISMR